MRVLIADDDSVSRRMLERMLRQWEYDVVAASDGLSARAILASPDAPRLAILDWMMPGATGPELCAELRSRGREPYTYVLLLTARDTTDDIVEGMGAGADDYITKPFDAQELQVRLRAGNRILSLEAELVAAREALREQATRDPLTRIWNRHAVLEALAREAARAERDGTSMGVILADLDHFKQVNDTYGHQAGDEVLREVCRRMQGCFRSYDYVGRYGGEEFLLVLSRSGRAIAHGQAERLREAVSRTPVSYGPHLIPVTISLGVAVNRPGVPIAPEELIRLADTSLYRAKERGRNLVECCCSCEGAESPTAPVLAVASAAQPRNG